MRKMSEKSYTIEIEFTSRINASHGDSIFVR